MLLDTNQRFRDPSAWYHVVVAIDSTQATQSNRQKVYLNGEQITSFSTETQTSQNREFSVNQASKRILIGNQRPNSSSTLNNYWDGYIAEYYLIDGQQLTPSSFAETDSTTGEYKPIKYTGSFGTNGFYLNFSDNSGTTATTLGKDSSGNGHNFTPNNFSVSAGAGNDSLEDTPTNNFCTLSSLLTDTRSDANFSNGNLTVTTGSGASTIGTTFPQTSGKWYAEFVCTAKSSVNMMISVNSVEGFDGERQGNESQNGGVGFSYVNNGNRGDGSSYGASWDIDDVMGIALDLDNNTVNFYKNNSAQGTISITSGYSYVMTLGGGQGGTTQTFDVNFGQRAFSYTPPTGFKKLNSQNLADPTIKLPNKHFATLLYTGAGSEQEVNGLSFQPDFVWLKERTGSGTSHGLFDSVRGRASGLASNLTNSEFTSSASNDLVSFDSDGFTVGLFQNFYTNRSGGYNYVAWNWKGGGAASSNSNGSITSSVSANTSAGFSIVGYTGNGTSGATVGHGLGVAPKFIITKQRSTSGHHWRTYHKTIGATKSLYLDLNNAQTGTDAGFMNNTEPTSTVFSLGDDTNLNENGQTHIAYCFSEVAGFSRISSWTGNGNADGVFIFTGFRPRFLLHKDSNSTEQWQIKDTARDTGNPVDVYLHPNLSNAEATSTNVSVDFLSNGFKIRNSDGSHNTSGNIYVFLAFAESPFKYSRAM